MKRSLIIPLALAAPLILAGCDDGAERITVLEQELQAERTGIETARTELEVARARVVELESAGADTATFQTERDAARTELEEMRARVTEMEDARLADGDVATQMEATRAELDAANARIVELETVSAQPTDLQASFGDPMKSVVVRLQNYQRGLRQLEGTISDNEAAVQQVEALQADLIEIGRDLSVAADGAGIALE